MLPKNKLIHKTNFNIMNYMHSYDEVSFKNG